MAQWWARITNKASFMKIIMDPDLATSLRDEVHMTFVLRGEGGGQPNSDQRKVGCVNFELTRGREGV